MKNGWKSRKLFVFIYVSLVFTVYFIVSALFAKDSVSVIGPVIIVTLGFFGSAYCGANVLDRYIELKHGKDKQE